VAPFSVPVRISQTARFCNCQRSWGAVRAIRGFRGSGRFRTSSRRWNGVVRGSVLDPRRLDISGEELRQTFSDGPPARVPRTPWSIGAGTLRARPGASMDNRRTCFRNLAAESRNFELLWNAVHEPRLVFLTEGGRHGTRTLGLKKGAIIRHSQAVARRIGRRLSKPACEVNRAGRARREPPRVFRELRSRWASTGADRGGPHLMAA